MRSSSLRPKQHAVWGVALTMLALMAACEGADDPSEAERAANIVADGADAGERATDSVLLPAAGMYHLPDTGNVTTLELKSDGRFRWVVHGCDYGGGDSGRWIAEGVAIVLLPRSGRDQFRWPGEEGLRWPARVVLRKNAALDQLDAEAETDAGNYAQSWLPGAWCAQCGGGVVPSGGIQLGPTGAYACEDAFGDSWIDY
jgi:hypothetical protein